MVRPGVAGIPFIRCGGLSFSFSFLPWLLRGGLRCHGDQIIVEVPLWFGPLPLQCCYWPPLSGIVGADQKRRPCAVDCELQRF
jgi:hypothetical protein